MHAPSPLSAGARVALVAPAGPLRSPSELDLAIDQARSLGWEPIIGPNALESERYLAGDDSQRLRDLNKALAADAIDGIWYLRGGYGAMRILEGLDTDAMRRHPKVTIGYSDVTALHAAFGNAAQVVTYHGPTARSTLTTFSRDSLVQATITRQNPCGHAPRARVLRPGRAQGRLVGGNLALLAALAGTRFAPDYTDGILIIEDVGEAVYRIDRMLRQLALSGALSNLAGIVYGQFTETENGKIMSGRSFDAALQEAADIAKVPAIAGAPFGHITDQWTIPLGAIAELDADALTLNVI